jgi:hypothetical protein
MLLELLTLAIALAAGFLRIGEAHLGWVNERLRAELLRRERFLVCARVGPYLSADETSAAARETAARGPRQRPRGATAPDSPKECRQCAVEGLLIVVTGASRRLLGRRGPFAER